MSVKVALLKELRTDLEAGAIDISLLTERNLSKPTRTAICI
jgi:hypothetical protein